MSYAQKSSEYSDSLGRQFLRPRDENYHMGSGYSADSLDIRYIEMPRKMDPTDITYENKKKLRKWENWGPDPDSKSARLVPENMRIKNDNFDEYYFKSNWRRHSPKFEELLKQIAIRDKLDFKTHGTLFKHVIYTDFTGYDEPNIQLVAAVMLSEGYVSAKYDVKVNSAKNGDESKYEVSVKLPNRHENEHAIRKRNVFTILSSDGLSNKFYYKPFKMGTSENDQSDLKQDIGDASTRAFNKRKDKKIPGNEYGEEIRFMLIDGGYKEGISLFDVRHIWILEPPRSRTALNQIIGRAARFCGSRGLPKKFWKLYVYVLYSVIEVVNAKTHHVTKQKINDLIMTEEQKNLAVAESKLAQLGKENSVDYYLFKPVHDFKKKGWDDPEKLIADALNIL